MEEAGEYERYVYDGQTDSKAETPIDQVKKAVSPDDRLVTRGQVRRLLQELAEQNPGFVLPDRMKAP